MLSEERALASDDIDVDKFFKAFELTTEFRKIMHSEEPLISFLPTLIKGWIEYQFLPYYFSNVPQWRLFVRKLLSKERIAPNYVMTGPGKSGSSDLVSHLLFHPNVFPPLVKEPKLHRQKNWRLCFPTKKEVQKLELEVGGSVRCGYLDPELHNLYVMNTLHALNPDCKIIITLRNPVDRAYSYWKWEVFVGGRRLKQNKRRTYFQNFSEYAERALDLFPSIPMESVSGSQVLSAGIYYKAVEQWINLFGKENVLVLDVAEYFQNRQPVFEKIQKFLRIPIIDIPEYGKKTNENPIKFPPPDKDTKSKLAKFYKPYNQKLFELIEAEFDWH
jgi:hypothetical protein